MVRLSVKSASKRRSPQQLCRTALGVMERGIERKDILSRAAATPGFGLVLFEAPAGFGKSYALAQWCEWALNARHTVGWIALRATEKQAGALASRIVETLRERGVKGLPSFTSGADVNEFVAAFTHSIARHAQHLFLALDDYQTIEGSAADEVLCQLLERLPVNMHIALASRRNVPLPLSRLRLQGRLLQLGPRSLLFSNAETRAFFGNTLGAWKLSSLYTLTEGWPAALRIAQLSLPEWQKQSGDIGSVPEFSRLIGEYCESEVLRQVDPEAAELLIECSMIEILEPRLCNAIRNQSDSSQLLAKLARQERFMEAVDVSANSWRVPTVLRQALIGIAAQRGFESAASANRRAARCFEMAGQLRNALVHYVTAQDPALAAIALERAGPLAFVFTQGDARGQELLELLPRYLLNDFPRIALFRVYLDHKRGLLDEARALLAETGARTDHFTRDREGGSDAQLKTESLCLELLLELFRRSRVPLDYLRSIETRMSEIGTSDDRYMTFFRITLGMLHAQRGDLEMADIHFMQCQKLNATEQASWVTLWLRYHSGSVAIARGHLMEARYHLQAGLKLWHSEFRAYSAYRILIRISLADIDYESDSLREAHIKLGDALHTAEHIEGTPQSFATLYETAMMLHWHAGHPDQVELLLARGATIPRISSLLERFLPVLRLRFELLQNRLDAAQRIVNDHDLERAWSAADYQDVFTHREWDLIGFCLSHLAIGLRAFDRAEQIADRLEQTARLTGRARTIVRSLMLRAAIASRTGKPEQARSALLSALELAQPLGLRRVFLDEGDLVNPILDTIGQDAADDVPAHLAAYAKSLSHAQAKKGEKPSPRRSELSEREHDVVRELSLGHSNKVIARKLDLAAPTVKFHINNVFRKLGVHKRAAVVAEAHRRGWLS